MHRCSHLSALYNSDILVRFVSVSPSLLYHFHNIHPVNDLAKDNMFVIQEWGRHSCNEELTAIGVGARVLVHISNISPNSPPGASTHRLLISN